MEWIVAVIWVVVMLSAISVFSYESMRSDNKSLREDNRKLRNEVSELESKIFDMRLAQIHNKGFIETGKLVIEMCDKVLEGLGDAE